VQRLPKDTLGLAGSQKAKNPNIPLAELESARLDGDEAVIALVQEVTQRSASAITKALSKNIDDAIFGKVITVCGGDLELANRIKPFAHLLRMDAWGDVIVYQKNSFAVTLGADRRETGTHYTPKSLTESIVNTTLEPVAYIGPAERKPREEWQIKPPSELLELKICDPAMGSGAFLVQVCRWLSERLVESWGKEEAKGKFITVDGIVLDSAGGAEPMPNSLDERLLIARRLVAERCLYGVDMNPLAVELAKLSIWLITLAKGRPFGFLDHNLRSGDSLLGIHDLKQLYCFDLHANDKTSKKLFAQKMDEHVNEALALRKKLRDIPIRDIQDVQYMERLDRQARQKLERIEHIADAIIGDALGSGGNEKAMETSMQALSVWASAYIDGNDEIGQKIISSARKALSTELPAGKPPRKPFHWALTFPEVFERGGFDGIVGNPPYMGGQKISSNFGTCYRDYIVSNIAGNSRGSADLCSYFVLQIINSLLRSLGVTGLILSSTIAEGDTREVGLQTIIQNGNSIYSALNKKTWPGKANVTFSSIWVFKGKWSGLCSLNNTDVKFISPYLQEENDDLPPYKLKLNANISFQGPTPLGEGFVINDDEAELLLMDPKNKDVLLPYLIAQDLNANHDHKSNNWIINFYDWPLERGDCGILWQNASEKEKKQFLKDCVVPHDYPNPVASDYPECLKIVRERVWPERQKQKDNADGLRVKKYWWRYGRSRPALFEAIEGLDSVLAIATQATKYVAFAIIDGGVLCSNSIAIIASIEYEVFGCLSSSIHEVWARKYGSYNLLLLRYSPSDLLETFPFPNSIDSIRSISKTYADLRGNIMLLHKQGLTSTLNKVHSSDELSSEILALREAQAELDNKVISLYGWDDLELNHNFYETPQGIRFTISEEARREVLQRLLKLNHERYAEEVAAGLHDKKKKATTPKEQNSLDLFDNAQASAGGAK
jgi:hypothetical protein